ncbi:glycosyltransferase family 39 protein [Candidatus Micrarchaeota archaeon]|nr:glycosyltransferase family 39 protein [Candidatus Micrarchaeota archaeon]
MREYKKVILLFFLAVFMRLIFLSVSGYIHVFPDASLFYEMARGFANGDLSDYYNTWQGHQFPLYPLILSLFVKLGVGLESIVWFNVILSSLVVIPAYLMSKNIKHEIFGVLFVILVALSPVMNYTATIMAENLFIPLFLFTFYFLDKWNKSKELYDKDLVYFFIFFVLTALTKITGLVFGPLFLILLIQKFISAKNAKKLQDMKSHKEKKKPGSKSKMIMLGIVLFSLILSVYMFSYHHGINVKLDFQLFINNLFYLVFGSFMLFWFIDWEGAFKNEKELAGILLALFVFFGVSLQSSHGRYLDPIIPIVSYLGINGWLRNYRNKMSKIILAKILIFIIFSMILLFTYFYDDVQFFYLSVFPIVILPSIYSKFIGLLSLLPLISALLKRDIDGPIIMLLLIGLMLSFAVSVEIGNLQGENGSCYKLINYVDENVPYPVDYYFVGNDELSRNYALLVQNKHPGFSHQNVPCEPSGVCIYIIQDISNISANHNDSESSEVPIIYDKKIETDYNRTVYIVLPRY